MKVSSPIFGMRLTSGMRYYQTSGKAQKLVVFSFFFVAALVMAAQFFGFWRGFLYLRDQEFFGPPLTLFMMEEFFLLVGLLLVLSSVIAGFMIFFRSSDTRFLLATPVSPATIFNVKFREATLISSWPVYFMGIPFAGAFVLVQGGGVIVGIYAILIFAAFVLLLSSVSAIIAFAVSLLLLRLPRLIALLILFAVVVALGFGTIHFLAPDPVMLSVIFEAANLEKSAATTALVSGMFAHVPSHWTAIVLFLSAYDLRASFIPLGQLVGAALCARILLALVTRIFYRRLLLRWFEFGPSFHSHIRKNGRTSERVFPLLFRGPVGAILEKDLLGIARNYGELARTGFIFFLLCIYMFAILVASRRIGGFLGGSERLVFAFHLIAISYFAAALALRFVYPAVSLEGRGAWMLWSSPVDRRALLRGKFYLFTVLFFLLMEIILFATVSTFGVSAQAFAIASVLLFSLIAAIVAAALSMGTLFADFRETSVDRLATSAGGIFTTIFSLTAGIFTGLVMFQALSVPGVERVMWVGGGVVGMFLLSWVFLSIASRKVYRLAVS